MTTPTKRQLRRHIDDLQPEDDDSPDKITIRYYRADENGELDEQTREVTITRYADGTQSVSDESCGTSTSSGEGGEWP